MWGEGKDHVTDYYFCMTNLQGIHHKNKQCVQYSDTPSSIRPVPHGPNLPIPKPGVAAESGNTYDRAESGECWSEENDRPVPLTQGLDYINIEWRCFINSSSRSLKAVLLHNGNKYSSITNGHSVQMKETHDNMDQLLSALNYHDHSLLICGDLKALGLALALQGGYIKYPCFLHLWDSRTDDQHYIRQEWPPRKR